MKREVRKLLNKWGRKLERAGLDAYLDKDDERAKLIDKQQKLLDWLFENPDIAEGLYERGELG